MRCVIGMDLHRTFAEVVIWEEGRLRHHGRIDMTRTEKAYERFVAQWQPRPPKGRVRERLNPTRLE